MFSFIIVNQLLKKFKKLDKIRNSMEIEFDGQQVYDRHSLKAKIKPFGKIRPKKGFCCVCLSIIVIGSVCQMKKHYYSQVYLKDFKHI